MENLKEIIPENIINYRKANNLTQLELAKKINFSDKAVSRWEKGEVLPDVETLQKLSEIFNIPLSSLLEKHDSFEKQKFSKPKKQEVLAQTFLICEVWTIISVIYSYLIVTKGINMWQIFVWGVPATALALLVHTRKNQNNLTNFIYGTIFVWSTITSIFLHMISSSPWYFYILGVPLQGILIVRYLFNYKQNYSKNKKQKKSKNKKS